MTQTDSDLCPDPEQLAALVDGRLARHARARIERHLLVCSSCRDVVAETSRLAREELAAAGARDRPSRPNLLRKSFGGRSLAAGGALLAITASLLFVARVQPQLSRFGAATPYQQLVAAVAANRPIEGRLTGGFQHGPVVRGRRHSRAADNPHVRAAAAKIRELADAHPTADNLHALGVAQVILHQYDAGIRALEEVVTRHPEDARYHSDLSAAYLARGRRNKADLPLALDHAALANRLDPDLTEAWFNHALALEVLNLEPEARKAWTAYLARDGSSAWAEEAREHLQATEPQSARPAPRSH